MEVFKARVVLLKKARRLRRVRHSFFEVRDESVVGGLTRSDLLLDMKGGKNNSSRQETRKHMFPQIEQLFSPDHMEPQNHVGLVFGKGRKGVLYG